MVFWKQVERSFPHTPLARALVYIQWTLNGRSQGNFRPVRRIDWFAVSKFRVFELFLFQQQKERLVREDSSLYRESTVNHMSLATLCAVRYTKSMHTFRPMRLYLFLCAT